VGALCRPDGGPAVLEDFESKARACHAKHRQGCSTGFVDYVIRKGVKNAHRSSYPTAVVSRSLSVSDATATGEACCPLRSACTEYSSLTGTSLPGTWSC
jgi:hypothetical protein